MAFFIPSANSFGEMDVRLFKNIECAWNGKRRRARPLKPCTKTNYVNADTRGPDFYYGLKYVPLQE